MDRKNEYGILVHSIVNDLKKYEKKNYVSSVLLFAHYLTNLFRWKSHFNDSSDLIKSKESHNLFQYFDADWKKDLLTVDEVINDFNIYGIRLLSSRFFNADFLTNYINWELSKDRGEIMQAGLPHPYEPVYKILQRNEIYSHNGQFYFNDICYANPAKYANFTLPSLDDSFLEEIDINEDFNNIPNLSEVNRIYKRWLKEKCADR